MQRCWKDALTPALTDLAVNVNISLHCITGVNADLLRFDVVLTATCMFANDVSSCKRQHACKTFETSSACNVNLVSYCLFFLLCFWSSALEKKKKSHLFSYNIVKCFTFLISLCLSAIRCWVGSVCWAFGAFSIKKNTKCCNRKLCYESGKSDEKQKIYINK